MFDLEKLKEQVRVEADNLRQYADSDELESLNFWILDPGNYCLCIYGQMTGDCHSGRARRLIEQCVTGYYNNIVTYGTNIGEVEERKQINKVEKYRQVRNFSPIELYITLPEAKNENLIAYLRGEIDTLEL